MTLPPCPVCDETVIAFVQFVSPRNRDLVQEFYHQSNPITQIDKHVVSLPEARGVGRAAIKRAASKVSGTTSIVSRHRAAPG